jgi:energy-coupling factor transport system ATP-binding protein
MAIVEIENLTYKYPLTEVPVLRDFDLRVEEGEFLAIVGPNGAGKTTLCYGIAGFLRHFFRGVLAGDVRVAGLSQSDTTLGEWVINVGLVFQNPFTQLSGSKLTVYEEIAFGLENIGVPRQEMIERIDKVMLQTGIADLADRSPYALSGGQQQRVALASIFVMRPKVLVLDEPTSQLDPIGTREVFQVIKEMSASGMTVIMAEHKVEWVARFADRVIALSDGQVVLDGPPHEVLTSPVMGNLGCNVTAYTSVARQAAVRHLWPPDRSLPITLEEAVAGFSGGQHGH